MGTNYADDGEEAQHEAAIESLANETHRPVSEIRPPYDRAFHACWTGRAFRTLSERLRNPAHTRSVARFAQLTHRRTSPPRDGPRL
jgi:hypothetical protein